MKNNRHPWAISILALLLLHATMSMAWPHFPANNGDSPAALSMELSAEHPSCHDSGESNPANGEKGCVFCGYAMQFAGSRICLSVSLELAMPAALVATAPRPEHPVEPPPPKIESLA